MISIKITKQGQQNVLTVSKLKNLILIWQNHVKTLFCTLKKKKKLE